MSDKFDAINNGIRYTNWTAFKRISPVIDAAQAEVDMAEFLAWLESQNAVLRGAYDLRGFRGDADLLFWIHADGAEVIQDALIRFGRTSLGQHFETTWSGMGIHRPAEFNRSHVPGFLLGKESKQWLCVYPFVRSYDWYLLPEKDRREMLVEHGLAGQKYSGIVSNTVASFALGDYEWLLALESNELHEIVDMMRDLRYTEARRHVREEVPFFTGQKVTPTEIGARY